VLFLFAQHLVLLMSPFPAQRASATDTPSNDSLGPLFGHAEKTGGLLLRLGMHAELFACEGRDQVAGDIKGSVSDVFRQFSMPHGSAVHLHTRSHTKKRSHTKNFRLGAHATLCRR
jgi:hypothetical protein